jgi:hypothetical protein
MHWRFYYERCGKTRLWKTRLEKLVSLRLDGKTRLEKLVSLNCAIIPGRQKGTGGKRRAKGGQKGTDAFSMRVQATVGDKWSVPLSLVPPRPLSSKIRSRKSEYNRPFRDCMALKISMAGALGGRTVLG